MRSLCALFPLRALFLFAFFLIACAFLFAPCISFSSVVSLFSLSFSFLFRVVSSLFPFLRLFFFLRFCLPSGVSCSCGVLVCVIGHVLMVGGSSLWDCGTEGLLGACVGERNCVSTEFSCCCRGEYDVTSFLCIFVVLSAICPNGARCTASSGPSFPMFLEVGLMTRQQPCLKSS